jgi:uncharacterized protein (DUF1015 family)
MAEIRPFRGYRYHLDNPDDLGRYAAPPYDMVDAAMVDELYRRDPLNTIRVIQNRAEPSDAANRDRHRRAAALLGEWMGNGRIARDQAPAVYVYRHTFTLGTAPAITYARTGIIVLVKLVDFAEGVVQPHENTLSGPKIDRYELLEELKVDTGLIFGIVPDDGSLLSAVIGAVQAPAAGRFTDRDGVVHELFPATDPVVIHDIQALMTSRTILIADGHHRYETSLNYHRAVGTPESAYVMMSLVSMADPGLVIRPFHRLVTNHERCASLKSVKDLDAFFTRVDLGPSAATKVHAYLGGEGAWDLLYHDSADRTLWGLKVNAAGRDYLTKNNAGMSEQWNGLNVSIINRLCVEGIMKQKLDGHVLHDVMDYVNDADVAFRKVSGQSGYRGAFFIRPIDIATVKQIVSQNERMPQKSTNFFPKLYSGLVFNSLEPR